MISCSSVLQEPSDPQDSGSVPVSLHSTLQSDAARALGRVHATS